MEDGGQGGTVDGNGAPTGEPVPGDASRVPTEFLLDIFNNLDAMVAYWDRSQVNRFANSAYREWFGKSPEQMAGITMRELLGPLYDANKVYIDAAFQGRKQVFERAVPRPGGGIRHSLATYIPHVVEGRVLGIFALVVDVGPLKQLEMELRAAKAEAEHLARHDFLTGLPNRTLLFDRIDQALKEAERNGRMVALLCMDIDDFKWVNDTFGHAEGDRLLVEIAARMRATLRESDSATRLGGDEFLLLTPEVTSVDAAERFAARVIDAVSQPFQLAGTTMHPGCSIGVALHRHAHDTPETLMARADVALYAAKRLGKNCYVLADSDAEIAPFPDSDRS